MNAFWRRMITPPVFAQDEAKTNAARVLYVIQWIMLVFIIGTGVYFSSVEFNRLRNLTIIIISALLILLMFVLVRRGNVYTAGRIYLGYMWILPIGLSLATRGILSPYPVFQIIVILLAAIVLSPNYSAGFAILSTISAVVLLLVSDELPNVATVVAEGEYTVQAISHWFVYVASYVITAVLIMYTSRMVNGAVGRLTQSEERYRMTSELISDYAFSYKMLPSGEVEAEWSTGDAFARITGYTPEEIRTQQNFFVFHKEDAERAKQDVQRVLNGEEFRAEYRVFTKSGQLRWLEIVRRPVVDEQSGRVVRYYGGARDITDRKQAEQRELDIAEARGRVTFLRDVVGNMTHDLKTPLAIINTSIHLLGRSNDPNHQARHLTKIQEQSNLLAAKIDDILTIAHLDSEPELSLRPLNINTLMSRVCEQLHAQIEYKQLRLERDFDNTLSAINGDEEELTRAFTNLLENAINYTPESGTIYVRTFSTDDHIVLEVRDTGMGIDEEHLAHIFDRFYRAPNAGSFKGTGLGLAIVERVVSLHGGEIEVSSTINVGTTFSLKFPYAS